MNELSRNMLPETELESYNKDTDTMANAMRIQKDKRCIQRTGDHVYLNVRKRPKDGFESFKSEDEKKDESYIHQKLFQIEGRRREEEAPDC